MAGGLRNSFDDNDGIEEVGEINVTPFIDVMLVLLIIFMVAAPMATVDAPVDLPKLNSQSQPTTDKPVYVSLQLDKTLLVGEQPVDKTMLKAALDLATENDSEKRILIRADRSIPYGDVIVVMNHLRASGYNRVALVGLDGASTAP
ncbi:TonB system transport protein ExbD [Devosia sp. MC521]|uniref:TonB system transport protein ExbD n=1 Tax=Devosia sp. MC521 TaxID=2759954 RepID=UPI0015FCE4DA|nr:TonB system transport protein ExbD [Devosia sp. MC521]MBJ6987821.1 TonB system transport protein ExbD [Devosia sp. MC521]QMW63727.1 TonB system transport protein ExbD [Devosia sp. MC521]